MIIMEIDPNTGRGKWLKICEGMLHTEAELYEPQLRKKVEEHGLKVSSVISTTLCYFLTATKVIQE
jgi:hypothetical protein